MNNELKKVKEFRRDANLAIGDRVAPINSSRWLHFNLILEETEELLHANHVVDQVDACIDIIYLALGALAEIGVTDIDTLFDIVHEANMSKVTSDIECREDGKILKPAGWVAPEKKLADALGVDYKANLTAHYQTWAEKDDRAVKT
jgi:hypothetical protein